MEILLILNDGPSDVGRSEAALQLAAALLRAEGAVVRVYLSNDAVRLATVAVADARAERSGSGITGLVNAGALVAVSDSALRERRIPSSDLVIGAEPAALSTLAAWCLGSDRLMVF